MRVLSTVAILAFVACGADNESEGGSTGPCSDIAEQICQKAAMCSAGGDAGVVFVIGPDEEAGVNAYPFSVNSEPGCEVLVGSGCNGSHAAAFTANCGSAIGSGLQCGPSGNDGGNGLLIPSSCGQNL